MIIKLDFEGAWEIVPSGGSGILPLGWFPYGDPKRTVEYGYPNEHDVHHEYLVKTGMKSLGYDKVWDTHKGGAGYSVACARDDLIKFDIFGRYIYHSGDAGPVSPIHMRIGVDPKGSAVPTAETVWSPEQEIAVREFVKPIEWFWFEVQARAYTETVTLFLYTNPTSAGFRGNGPVWDDGTVEIVSSSECWGEPREQFKRVINVTPSVEIAHKVLDIIAVEHETSPGAKDGFQMVGPSSDEAGLGMLEDKTAVEWNRPLAQQEGYKNYYATHYPQAKLKFRTVDQEEPGLPLFSQRDPRWRDIIYGGGMTLGQAGCMITCVAMLTGDEPPVVAQKLTDAGALVGAYLSHPELVTDAYPDLPYGGTVHWRNVAADLDALASWLEAGPVVVETEFLPGGAPPPSDQHFVVGLEIDGEDLIIADPWTGERTRLLQRYALDNWNLARALYGARLFGHESSPQPPIPPAPIAMPQYIAPHAQSRHYEDGLRRFIVDQNDVRGFKGFSAQDCQWAQDVAAAEGREIWTQYRKFFSTQDLSSPPQEVAKFILDAYEGDVIAYPGIRSVETFNEIMDSSVAGVKRAVAIEVECMLEAERRRWDVKLCVHNTGVGNPQESQVVLMLPMAQVAHEGGHLAGLHCYGGADRNQSYLLPDLKYHAGRWMEQDDVFLEHGFAVRWFLGEAGPIGAGPRNPETNYLPLWWNQGWRHKDCMNGDWLRTFEFLTQFSKIIHTRNRLYGDRVIAYAPFTTGGPWLNWDWFQYMNEELIYLAHHR